MNLKFTFFLKKIVDKWEEKSLPTNIILSSIVLLPPIKKPILIITELFLKIQQKTNVAHLNKLYTVDE